MKAEITSPWDMDATIPANSKQTHESLKKRRHGTSRTHNASDGISNQSNIHNPGNLDENSWTYGQTNK